MQYIVSYIFIFSFFSYISNIQIDFPTARKFHSIFPFHNNQIIMFGGAHFNRETNHHIVVNNRIWTFDFEKLEWAVLSLLTMPKPTYFHAAAMNEVKKIRILFYFISSFI